MLRLFKIWTTQPEETCSECYSDNYHCDKYIMVIMSGEEKQGEWPKHGSRLGWGIVWSWSGITIV
jgi:hypothetical protein